MIKIHNRKPAPFWGRLSIIFLIFAHYLHGESAQHYAALASEKCKAEQFQEAIEYFNKALELTPRDANLFFQLGYACMGAGKLKSALDAYLAVVNLAPHAYVPAMHNVGYLLKVMGLCDRAIAIFHEIIKKDENYEPARLGLSFAYIAKGDFENGWKYHQWNLIHQGKNADRLRFFLESNDIAGKRILCVPEGGFGDTLQFIRYAEHLKNMGAYVIVAVQSSLLPLCSRCQHIDELVPTGRATLPSCDARVTLMSIPMILGDSEDKFAPSIPYIYPDPQLVDEWRAKLATHTDFKIGICWQADVHNDSSRLPMARRGIPLHKLFILKDIPGISFFSLQKKEGLEQLADIPADFKFHIFEDNFDEEHGSFMDTAAIMSHLDLIITIDSAIAHLAGALGKKVWLLLPYSTDWRWIIGRTDSPWYPTMRIFKQPRPFDWDSVVDQVHNALRELVLSDEQS